MVFVKMGGRACRLQKRARTLLLLFLEVGVDLVDLLDEGGKGLLDVDSLFCRCLEESAVELFGEVGPLLLLYYSLL